MSRWRITILGKMKECKTKTDAVCSDDYPRRDEKGSIDSSVDPSTRELGGHSLIVLVIDDPGSARAHFYSQSSPAVRIESIPNLHSIFHTSPANDRISPELELHIISTRVGTYKHTSLLPVVRMGELLYGSHQSSLPIPNSSPLWRTLVPFARAPCTT
ncbi:uncharacterized protein LOC124416246 [Diprion similis]|uniref:uncharacterized protein LOC124416246 n=1 Tax=Diprion similis TaxID=362088 RepID=UPI001EF87E26|nr:uncharacterized protein LOC124416246 [Diprion similis]